jgi:transcriptional regulator with XRE-family HTH domain
MPEEAPHGSPALLRRRLALQLRRLRDAAGLSIDEVAVHLCCSTSKVSRIETGRVTAMQRDVKDMLDLYGVGGQRRDVLLELARLARRKEDWWIAYSDVPDMRTYISLERAANSIRICQSVTVPGLLQVERYARLVITRALPHLRGDQIERLVALRMKRRAVLHATDPPILEVVMDEAALHRLEESRELLREQVGHLIGATALPNVTVQVLPFSAGPHGALAESFRILGFPDPADSDVVHLENLTGNAYLTNEAQVSRYRDLFERLRALAWSPERSLDLLTELLRPA